MTDATSVEARLAGLGLRLPTPSVPVANYVPWSRVGDLVFVSGQVSAAGDEQIKGVVGDDLSLADGVRAARLCGLSLLSHLRVVCGEDFGRLRQVVKLSGFVQASADLEQIPQVMNGCSDLMVAAFGDRGRHARTAVGAYRLPRGFAVEVDAIVAVS